MADLDDAIIHIGYIYFERQSVQCLELILFCNCMSLKFISNDI